MKTTWLLIGAMALAPLVAPRPAVAAPAGDCQAAMRELSRQTEDMLFYGKDLGTKAQTKMLSSLSQAMSFVAKLDAKSTLKQLDDYSTELSRATATRLLKVTDAIVLQERTNDIIQCVNTLDKQKK
jgi:hypothetical protein